MAYPTGLKIYIDGKDCTFYIFGANTFDPTPETNVFRDIDITPYLRTLPENQPAKVADRRYSNSQVSNLHTIQITAQDGNGRVEARVEIR